MKSLFYILLLLVCSLHPAYALQLGQIEVTSYLNEPLKATLPLNNIDVSVIEDIKVNLAQAAEYKQIGLSRPHYLTKLKFNILAGPETEHAIQITSRDRIREPIMEVLLKVADQQNIVMRLYTVMLDLRDTAVVSNVVSSSSQAVATPIVDTSQMAALPQPIPQNTAASPAPVQKTSPSINQAQTASGVLAVKDQSISIIAQNSPLAKKYSVYQIMRAFYLLNPNAFWKGNINLLQSGVNLAVPDEEFVAEVTRQQAVNFVYSVSKEVPAQTVTAVATDNSLDSKAEEVVDTSQKKEKLDVEKATQNEFTISEDIRDDIKSWRTLIGELKTITSALNRQNKAIQVQNSVIEEMNSRLETKASDIELLSLRVSALESIGNGGVLSGNSRDTTSDWSPVTQTLEDLPAANETAIVDENLINNEPAITVQGLIPNEQSIPPLVNNIDQSAPITVPQPMSTAVAVAPPEIIPVPQIVVTEDNVSPLFSTRNLYGMLIIVLIIIVAIVVAIWLKSRATKTSISPQEPAQRLSDERAQTSESLASHPDMDMDLELDLELQPETEVEKKPKKRRQKGEVTNFEDTYEVIQVPVVSSKSRLNLEVDSEDNVHAEIDLLVAYQEYEEARNLLESAREKFADDRWLDIMELKILAYSKDVDMFFFKFEKYKDKLSAEYPMQWEKILLMRDKLNLELTKSKAAII